MSAYDGNVQSADKDRIDVRKSPVTGMKIGALKIGTHIKGDRLETGSDGKLWMHLNEPIDGWALASQLRFTESAEAPVPAPVVDPLEPSTLPDNLYKVKIWGDRVMVKQGFDVNFAKTSNFQAIPLFIEDGSCGAVSSFLRIPREDIDHLINLQIPDNYNVEQKMGWLCDYRGHIYMYDDQGDNWESSPFIRWGTIALGGNLVMVEDIVSMVAKPPDGIKRKMDMARLISFRKTDWGKTWASHPHLVHRAYCAYKGNQFGDSPKGIVYTPFFSPLDWDFAGTIQPKAWYLPLEWLDK